MSGRFPVKLLCELMGIQRSSFYNWKRHLSRPASRTKQYIENISLFSAYHLKYPSHGYRWLNAKIRLDTGLVLSDPYAHKCCKAAGIKSKTNHYRYKKPGEPGRVYPNLLLSEINPAAADTILARGMMYGDSRVIVGAHWQSDIDAGRLAAGAACAALHTSHDFLDQLAKARAEFRRLTGKKD